ncbi:MAG: lipopolysaccharide biosynthesis protein [Burkholderiaceae bacterium]
MADRDMASPMDEMDDDDFDMQATMARLRAVRRHWRVLLAALVVGGAVGYGGSFAVKPTFLSTTLFIPPQQQTGGAASALASLGALSSLIGAGAGVKNSTDEYISMLQSVTVSDHIIKRYDLAKVYDTDFKDETRKRLSQNVQITAGKKDGLIRVEVEDVDPRRAASMANQYVEELRIMTSRLAVTEAQQRRMFFERMMDETKQKLVAAQVSMEATGINAGTLKAEPRSAAEIYAKLRAELTAAQVRLQVARGSLAETAPQVQQEQTRVQALGAEVARLETSQQAASGSPDYIGKYRDFKYQETLFELYAKQYELARADEAREGAMVQVIDEAQVPERKHAPHRSLYAALAGLALALALAIRFWRREAATSAAT